MLRETEMINSDLSVTNKGNITQSLASLAPFASRSNDTKIKNAPVTPKHIPVINISPPK